jgi:hypothetical protein
MNMINKVFMTNLIYNLKILKCKNSNFREYFDNLLLENDFNNHKIIF